MVNFEKEVFQDGEKNLEGEKGEEKVRRNPVLKKATITFLKQSEDNTAAATEIFERLQPASAENWHKLPEAELVEKMEHVFSVLEELESEEVAIRITGDSNTAPEAKWRLAPGNSGTGRTFEQSVRADPMRLEKVEKAFENAYGPEGPWWNQ